MKRQKRFEKNEKRPINMDALYSPWPDGGLEAMDSPHDPKPSLTIRGNEVVEMDGKTLEEFDSIDYFISRYAINLDYARVAMELPSQDIARMLVDINVPREEVITVTTAITPAKMLEVLRCLNPVEIMMAQMKMRKRRTPANQAHVTNISDNPVLMAADAAEAAARGFAGLETTCAVSRYAPMSALAIMIGGLAAKPGVLTQCSMEEALELKLGMSGITSQAETISLYGTEKAMDDGGDTIWSKGFLASAYASRGIKMRCTSGTGSEVLLGHANGRSMLYLELLCVYMARGCGVQGIQNGSISCIGIVSAVPKGFVAIAAENLAVSLLDMEVASGNDQTFTHSDIRKTAKLLMQMLPGTDFVSSGYSAMPNLDDVFAGSNTDCDDYDDWYMIQRDMRVDGGIEPISEQEAISVRNRGVKALQAVFESLGLPPITDEEMNAAIYAYSYEEMPERDRNADMNAAGDFLSEGKGVLDVLVALKESGFTHIAENLLTMIKTRICGDYLQTGAIFSEKEILGGLNDPNRYEGPGTGYRIDDKRWQKLSNKESAIVPEDILKIQKDAVRMHGSYRCSTSGRPTAGMADVMITVSPAFLDLSLGLDMCRLQINVLEKLMEGIRSKGLSVAVVKEYTTGDIGEMARIASDFSRFGLSVAVQINGRVIINDNNKAGERAVRGYFYPPMYSPEEYFRLGEIVASCALDEGYEVEDRIARGRVSDYQLKMVGNITDESKFIKPYRGTEILRLDE